MHNGGNDALDDRHASGRRRSAIGKAHDQLRQYKTKDCPAAPGMDLMQEQVEGARFHEQVRHMRALDCPGRRHLYEAKDKHGPMHQTMGEWEFLGRTPPVASSRAPPSQVSTSTMSPARAA